MYNDIYVYVNDKVLLIGANSKSEADFRLRCIERDDFLDYKFIETIKVTDIRRFVDLIKHLPATKVCIY